MILNCFVYAALPKFIGCIHGVVPCNADKVYHFTTGDSIRFNISVGYTDGGPSGMRQEIRLVSLGDDPPLVNCLNSNPSSCIVNPSLPSNLSERFIFRRDESHPWFDIEIILTSALPSDSDVYPVVLEAEDMRNPARVTRSTSLVTVSVTPSSSIPVIYASSKLIKLIMVMVKCTQNPHEGM